MHLSLRRALDLVVADLVATGAPVPVIVDDDQSELPTMTVALLNSPDGSSIWVRCLLDHPPAEQVVEVADQVQDWAIDELAASQRSAAWPSCPAHPGTHPLDAGGWDGLASWRCPSDPRVVVSIGSLR